MKSFLLLSLGLSFLAALLWWRPVLYSSTGVSKRKRMHVAFCLSLITLLLAAVLYVCLGGAWQVQTYESESRFMALDERLVSVEVVIDKLRTHLAVQPDEKGWYLLGRLYQSQGRSKEAEAAFKESKRYHQVQEQSEEAA